MKDQMNIHNDKGFEDIEQLLQPQCDFHASSQTKQQVIEKARKSLVSHRTLRIFPWICAACVAGIIAIILQPPKDTTSASGFWPHTKNYQALGTVGAGGTATVTAGSTKITLSDIYLAQEYTYDVLPDGKIVGTYPKTGLNSDRQMRWRN